MIVLDDLFLGGALLIVQNDADEAEEDGLDYFEDEVHGLSEGVEAVAFEDGPKLGAPTCFCLILNLDLNIEVRFLFPSYSFAIDNEAAN